MKKFSDLNIYIKVAIIIVSLIIIYFVARAVYRFFKEQRQQKILEESKGTATVNGQPISIDLGTKASAIYNAFYSNDWFGFSEDEETAMAELSNVPKSLIPKLSEIYNKLYKKNLKNDFQRLTSAEQWSSISYLFS